MDDLKYNLEIIGEKTIYSPRKEIINPIVNSDKRIFAITADNSYGKTFILNLIAYALDADKLDSDRILPAIKESISRYDDKEAYNLDYTIDLVLPDNKKLSLTKEKGRGKIIQIDESSPISYSQLHKDLAVIYDVPSNPSERLNAVIKDLGIWNRNLQSKFNGIVGYLNQESKEFDSIRSEEKIADYKAKFEKTEIKIKETKEKLSDKNNLTIELTTLVNLRQLNSYLKAKDSYNAKVLRLTKSFKSLKKPQKIVKKDEVKLKQYLSELTNIESEFRRLIAKLISHINNDNEILDLITEDPTSLKYYNNIQEKDIQDIILTNSYITVQENFIKHVDHIKDEILIFVNERKNDKSYIIHNSYKDFIALLENLIENDIDHLLKTATSVDSAKLKKQLESIILDHKIKNYDEIKRFFKDALNPLKGLLKQYYRTNILYEKESKKKLVSNTDSDYYKVEAQLKENDEKLKEANNLYRITAATCCRDLGISDFTKIDTTAKILRQEDFIKQKISDDELTNNLSLAKSNLDKEIQSIQKRINEFEIEKGLAFRSYERENAKTPSKYTDDHKTKIKLFSKLINRIIANTSQFNSLISNIEKGDLSKFKENEDIQFIKIAGGIIAYSMDNKLLRADGEFVELISYDMIKQEFHCSNNLIIKKDDVSTGLASANYLKQRIENVEGKYVVVLLDEIGNMAQNALDTVIESIKKLENQNRLVLAVFTRPNSNGIEIIDY